MNITDVKKKLDDLPSIEVKINFLRGLLLESKNDAFRVEIIKLIKELIPQLPLKERFALPSLEVKSQDKTEEVTVRRNLDEVLEEAPKVKKGEGVVTTYTSSAATPKEASKYVSSTEVPTEVKAPKSMLEDITTIKGLDISKELAKELAVLKEEKAPTYISKELKEKEDSSKLKYKSIMKEDKKW